MTIEMLVPVVFILGLLLLRYRTNARIYQLFAGLGVLWLALEFKDKDFFVLVGFSLFAFYLLITTFVD